MLTRIWLSLVSGFALVVLMHGTASSGDKDVVILGTATPGGGFPAYGAAFAETVNQNDTSLDVRPRNTKGSTENVSLLAAEGLDIALVQGEVVHETFSGKGSTPLTLKIIVAMYSAPGMFMVRADSPYRAIRDLVGKPVVFGARGSGLVILSRYILDGIGLDQDRDFQAVYLDKAGDGPSMVTEGRAAALWGGGMGWPGFETLAKASHGARFIVPSEDEIKRIQSKYAFLQPLLLPAGSYPGQDTAISSVGSWSFVLARRTLPDDVAYRLARALDRGSPAMGARLPQARQTTMTNTIVAAPCLDLIHPGVLQYLREINLVP